ncbi:MAG: hypothetical protein KFF49_06930 [Bacteroidales bacterium]|nr:hypothetical protein [Bacteroidales bacterium]
MSRKTMTAVSNIAFTCIIIAIAGLTACEKYSYDPPVYVPPDTSQPYDTVYYASDVAPLFPKYNCTGCHGGAIAPDLRVTKSYEELTEGAYIDLDKPLESSLIIKIDDPGHGGTFNNKDRTKLLDWIYQGAQDN